jgi:cytochrome c551/c552
MNTTITTVLVLLFLAAPIGASDQGKSLFKSQGCTVCHRPEKSSKVNPSLMEIARFYQGKTDQLVRYMNGEAEAIVKPDKERLMRRYIEKTKELSEAQRQAIADYIMSYLN